VEEKIFCLEIHNLSSPRLFKVRQIDEFYSTVIFEKIY
jgi:hypothetical protein